MTFWPAGWEGWTDGEAKCRCHDTCAAFNATLVNTSHPSWTAVRASMLPAGHTCDLPPSPPSPPASPPLPTGPFYVGADFPNGACAGAPVREWSVPDIPTSAAAADLAHCISPYGNWSAHGEWCDFSAPAGPTLNGVYFADASDCSTAGVGYGSNGTGQLADGTACRANVDGTSTRYKCVASVCATGDSAFCSSSHNDCHVDGATDTPSCYAGYVAGPSPEAPRESTQYTCFPSHCPSCNASKCTSAGDDCWYSEHEAPTCADGYQPAHISATLYTCCYDPTPRPPPSPPPPTASVSAACDTFNCYIDLERITLPPTFGCVHATSQEACARECCKHTGCRGFEFRESDQRCCATDGSRAFYSEHPCVGAPSPTPQLGTLARLVHACRAPSCQVHSDGGREQLRAGQRHVALVLHAGRRGRVLTSRRRAAILGQDRVGPPRAGRVGGGVLGAVRAREPDVGSDLLARGLGGLD